MNSQKDMAWPSYARIIDETGLARSTIAKYLKLLESEGWLFRDHGYKGKNTIYHARFPKIIEESLKIHTSTPDELVENTSTSHELTSTLGELTSTPDEHELDNKQDKEQDNNIYVHFDDFWIIYPRKTNKAKAAEKWKRMKVEEDLFLKIRNHLSVAYLNTEPQYIPHATTYLNGKRWNDEIITTQIANQPTNSTQTQDFVELHTSTEWAEGL